MKKKLIPLVLVTAMSLFFSGCTKEQAPTSQNEVKVTYKDQSYQLPQSPKRIAVLSTSLLTMFHAIDGEAIARPDTKELLPEKLKKLPTLGQTNNINAEALLSLKPDLVLGLKAQNEKISPILESNKIPNIMINYDGIHDNIPLLTFFGKLIGKEARAKEVSEQYEKNFKFVQDEAKKFTPARVAVLRATGKSVTAETEKAITASMVKELGMKNVLLEHKNIKLDSNTVPYSLEVISEDNPDIIFIVTMGDMEEINKTLAKEMTGNPAWSQLKAVKENKVFFLPQKLFLLNPGLATPEAMATLVKLAYDKDIKLNAK